MKILGIDPGSDRMGYGLIEVDKGKYKLLTVGCITTQRGTSDAARLVELYNNYLQLLESHSPDVIAIESLFFGKNAKTIIPVGQARGVILLASAQKKIDIVSYTPLEVKLAVTGYGKAEKKQVQQMVKSILKLTVIPKPDDAADAVAIALTHGFNSKMKQIKGNL